MKLVRDFIPAIIEGQGKTCDWKYIQGKEQFSQFLKDKMEEETSEFLEDPCEEEAADMLEVVMTFMWLHALDPKQVEEVRRKKALSRGSFQAGIVLL